MAHFRKAWVCSSPTGFCSLANPRVHSDVLDNLASLPGPQPMPTRSIRKRTRQDAAEGQAREIQAAAPGYVGHTLPGGTSAAQEGPPPQELPSNLSNDQFFPSSQPLLPLSTQPPAPFASSSVAPSHIPNISQWDGTMPMESNWHQYPIAGSQEVGSSNSFPGFGVPNGDALSNIFTSDPTLNDLLGGFVNYTGGSSAFDGTGPVDDGFHTCVMISIPWLG